jgi:hypothetical protein
MTERTWWDRFRIEGGRLPETLTALIRQGEVRHVVIQHEEGWVVAEFPLTSGLIGGVLARMAAMVALLGQCTVRIDRVDVEAARVARMQTTSP